MSNTRLRLTIVAALLLTGAIADGAARGQEERAVDATPKFVSVALGVTGGLDENDLSAFLLAPAGSTDFVSLDAGTLTAGIRKAASAGSFWDVVVPADAGLTLEGFVLQRKLKAYLISHAHLDHIAGLIHNSPDDSAKPIMALSTPIDYIRDHVFNWNIWPNFGNDGSGFRLNKYTYVRLQPEVETPLPGTSMTVTPFVLAHSAPYESTAFLVQAAGYYCVYFGDTGPDVVEKSDRLKKVWQRLAPLLKAGKLRGVFLEASYPNERPDSQLFGHLTPAWLARELTELGSLVHPIFPALALRNLTVIVTHIKPSFQRGPSPRFQIINQLEDVKTLLGVKILVPRQGDRIEF